MATKLENAKAEKNSAQANLYNTIAGILTVAVLGAVIYFIGGWLLAALYKVVAVVVYLIALIPLLDALFKTRKSISETVAKSPTNRHYLHQWFSKKAVDECTDEEKAAIKEEIKNGVWGVYILYGALWFLPVLTAFNSAFQIAPLTYLAPIAMIVSFLYIIASLVVNLSRLSDDKIDGPFELTWSFKGFLFSKIIWTAVTLYYLGIGMIAFGVSSFSLIPVLIAAAVIFLLSFIVGLQQ